MVQRIIFTSLQKGEVERILDEMGFQSERAVKGYISTRVHPSINHGRTFMASSENTEPAPHNPYARADTRTRLNIHEVHDGKTETQTFSAAGSELYGNVVRKLRDYHIVDTLGNPVDF